MAKYRFTTYGSSKYGEPDNSRLYYASNIFAWAYDYGSISVTWSSVIPDPADDPYIPTHWRLVRTFVGVPDDPYAGEALIEDTISNFKLTYVDEDVSLETNSEVTYTLWVFNGQKWINCGSYTTNSIARTNTAHLFKSWLPAAWLNNSAGVGDAIGEPESSSLTSVVDAYSFGYDKIKVQADLLLNAVDPVKIPTSLLKNKITDLGFKYEPSLGDVYHRTLYKAGHFINSLKGTVDGIYSYSIALTHWPTSIEVGLNLMLDYNDSSFEESTGRWYAEDCTLVHQPYQTSATDIGIAVLPPTPHLYDHDWAPRQQGFGLVTAAPVDSAGWYLRLPALDADHVKYGIPVTAGKNYIAKAFIKHLDTAPHSSGAICLFVHWVDKDGNDIYAPEADILPWKVTTTSWQEFESPSSGTKNGMTAPEGAAYAWINIFAIGDNLPVGQPIATGARFAIDMLQFREAAGTEISLAGALPGLEYQDPRLVKVVSDADLVNYIPNPTFDSGTHFWESFNADIYQDHAAPAAAHVYGSTSATKAVAKLVVIGNGSSGLTSDWQKISNSEPHTFSIHASSASPRTAVVRLEFSSKQSSEDQIKIFSDVEGRYYDPTPYYVDSDPVVLTPTAQRISVTALTPDYTSDNGYPLSKASIYITDAQAGDVIYLDGAMLTRTSEPKDFFTGSGAITPTNPNSVHVYPDTDCFWDIRNQLNFVSNSTFNNTTGWAAASGTTLTTDSTVTPLFGTTYGKVSATGGGSISTVVTYPMGAVLGGEDVIITAYVRNVAGTYNISTTGQPIYAYKVDTANKDEWTRITAKRIAEIGETTFTLTISLVDAGSGTKVFYVDGVQAEYGRVATPFINPASAATYVDVNPADPTKSISYAHSEMINAGYSFYAENYETKISRLADTLPLVMPTGATWAIVGHESELNYPDIETTLLPASSFETSLEGWSGTNAKLTRTISRGSLFDDILTHGNAYCKVSSLASGAFSAKTTQVKVSPSSGYYTSVAIKPENEDAYGHYTLTLNWYTGSNTFLRKKSHTIEVNRSDRWAYLDVVAPASKTITLVSANVAANVVTLTTTLAHGFDVGEQVVISVSTPGLSRLEGAFTISAVTETTFSYLKTTPVLAETAIAGSVTFSNTGVSYANLEITCEPFSGAIGRTFHLDKVIFRE